MPYYGQQPSGQQLQQASGGNPFYNPYSPYPNIGMGISSVLQNVMAQKQIQEQTKYEREQEKKKMELEERRAMAYEESSKPRVKEAPEWEQKIDAILEVNPDLNRWEATKLVLGISDTEQTALQEKVDALIKAGHTPESANELAALGRPPRTPVSQTPEAIRDKEISANETGRENSRKKDEKRILAFKKKLEKDIADNERALEGWDKSPDAKRVISGYSEATQRVIDLLSALEISTVEYPLNEDARKIFDSLVRNYSKIKEGTVIDEIVGTLSGVGEESAIPQEVQGYMEKNPGVTLEVAMGLYQEWLKKK